MITVQILGAKETVANLGTLPNAARARLLKTFQRVGYGLQAHIQKNKLSGQVLNQRSGRLRESIHAEFINEPTRIATIVGTNVEYAAAHEFGFHGEVQVKAHTRKGFPVREHQRKMNLPERSFLRSSLRDYYTTAIGMVNRDLGEVLRTGR